MVAQTRYTYFAEGCIYLVLRNQINAAIMRMRTWKLLRMRISKGKLFDHG